ncbi:phage tail sheath family protein [Embleya sp. NPDC059259]|uniref:phage tail sheath family protein n=1 Tax=unclassified Embleya TaxID=2699296 RepID=UPI00369A1114
MSPNILRAPGVYLEENSSGVRIVTGTGTSTPAFLGYAYLDPAKYSDDTAKAAERARRAKPYLLRGWSAFAARYDVDVLLKAVRAGRRDTSGKTKPPPDAERFLLLAEAVYAFFANGGTACYVGILDEAKPDLDGDDAVHSGLAGLKSVHDVTMVAVPVLWDIATANGSKNLPNSLDAAVNLMRSVTDHCSRAGNRLAILDAPRTPDHLDSAWDGHLTTLAGNAGTDNDTDKTFGTLYYPWVRVPGLDGDTTRAVPPCGHIAGVWAATDTARGVFKAPANIGLAAVLEPLDVVGDARQQPLNDAGVNCLRVFPGRGLLVWGARTLSDTRDWRYVNVRRLVCFLEDSIVSSSRWVVFEPNDERLWASLRHAVSAFLTDQWRAGALAGRTPGEAFYVVCDDTNNTPDTVDRGHVYCDIGVAPVRPAEFVVFRVTQIVGQAGQTTV